ncbi:MAG: GHKL domain-containing protein [Burkholderiales bacterium]|nr:GHKL domain-containing protein [Phycisphaerae bacterium]
MTATEPTTSSVTAERVEELGRIIMAYSEVTERLQQSHDQLNGRVQQLQAELSEKNRQLERSNRLAALGEMAAGLAHEIRNPLGGIQLYASMLAQDVADRPESHKTVIKIIGGVKRLEGLVSQVLHFTREISAHPAECDAAQVVRDAVELAQLKAHERPVTVTCHTPNSLIHSLDERLFGQAIINLVHNAIEAIDGVGTVRVSLTTVDGKLILSIDDSGPGLAPQVLDRIFNPFFTTKDDGTGLGLAIVHRIVEAHGGTISASNIPGGGARFEVRV